MSSHHTRSSQSLRGRKSLAQRLFLNMSSIILAQLVVIIPYALWRPILAHFWVRIIVRLRHAWLRGGGRWGGVRLRLLQIGRIEYAIRLTQPAATPGNSNSYKCDEKYACDTAN
ncbi:hypothetical protein GQ53DRAFT_526254 [Thozetella sp. PMI_491]|nr:hypothetical protein GQ53DRAFT_526254 [Thozetella sp. PMI_491]